MYPRLSMAQEATIVSAAQKLKYFTPKSEYVVRLRHRHRPWWLLLFLLLLFFVRCEKDISVTCIDNDSDLSIADVEVNVDYNAHYLFNHGKFFAKEHVNRTQTTDDTGNTIFRDLPCSVFSYLFYCLSKAAFVAQSDCHELTTKKVLFHPAHNIEIKMNMLRSDLVIQLRDLVTDEILPDASVIYRYYDKGQERLDSTRTNNNGVATLRNMPRCGIITEIVGSCKEHYDTLRIDVPCQRLLTTNDSTTLRLRPVVLDCEVDIVFCIDNTGSMGNLLNSVKQSVLRFYNELQAYCHQHHRNVANARIKVVSFGDLAQKRIEVSPLYKIPDKQDEYRKFVSKIVVWDGGDTPESSLEALSLAMDTEWAHTMERSRHIIILFTDAPAHPLGTMSTRYYPKDMPRSMTELEQRWNVMDETFKRMILFAPNTAEWQQIATWTNVKHTTENINDIASRGGMLQIYEAICKAL